MHDSIPEVASWPVNPNATGWLNHSPLSGGLPSPGPVTVGPVRSMRMVAVRPAMSPELPPVRHLDRTPSCPRCQLVKVWSLQLPRGRRRRRCCSSPTRGHADRDTKRCSRAGSGGHVEVERRWRRPVRRGDKRERDAAPARSRFIATDLATSVTRLRRMSRLRTGVRGVRRLPGGARRSGRRCSMSSGRAR